MEGSGGDWLQTHGKIIAICFVLALAGSLAQQGAVPTNAGTLPTHRLQFVLLVTGVVIIVAGLTFVPAQSLSIVGVIMLWGGISFAIYPVGLALLGQRFNGGDIARANTAFSLIYVMGGLVGRPLTGAAMDAVGEPGLGWTLGFFYAIATAGALLAMRRRG